MARKQQIIDRDEDWEEVEVQKPAEASVVYSIRFKGPELAGLRAIARREGIRISDIVHRAIDFYLAVEKAPTIRMGSPLGGVNTHVYSEGPGPETTGLPNNVVLFERAS